MRRLARSAAAVLATLSFLTACTPAPARGSGLVVVGATVFDGTGAPPVADAFVVVEGDRIKAVGPQTHVPLPKGVPVLDARGKFVVPYLDPARAAEVGARPGESQSAANVLSTLWASGGALTAGGPADFLILDLDPRTDLSNLSRVHRTIRGGQVVAAPPGNP